MESCTWYKIQNNNKYWIIIKRTSNDAKTITHNIAQTDAHCLQAVTTLKDNPCSLQAPSCSTTTFSYWAWCYRYGICLWPLGVNCLSCIPSQLLGHPHSTYWGQRGGKNERGLTFWKHSSAIAKALVCNEHCFSQNCTLLCQLLWSKKTSIPVSPSTKLDSCFKYWDSSFKSIFALE